jgi:hypothetical protein
MAALSRRQSNRACTGNDLFVLGSLIVCLPRPTMCGCAHYLEAVSNAIQGTLTPALSQREREV